MAGVVLFGVTALVIIELLALAWLYFSIGSYKNFWIQKAKQPGEITYLALGDSAAQGIGATSPMRGYVGLLAKRIEAKTGKTVKIVNISSTGATIRDAINEQVPKAKTIKADLVTIEIGANDIKTFQPERFRSDFSVLLEQLPKDTYVSNMPLFNSRPGSTEPARQASQIIQELTKDSDFRFVDLQKQTTEHQSIFGFAPDLFHPNNLSYKNWAEAFWMNIKNI